MIAYIRHSEIERQKWDRCIAGASFETLYPYSWYLDLVSPGWDALVMDDYQAVMPLTWSRRYGLYLLLQPVLAQQLGVFAAEMPDPELLAEFFRAIPSRFRLVDICLNCQNLKLPGDLKFQERVNFELDLRDSATSYSTNTSRNLAKGKKHPFELREIGVADYLDLKYSDGEHIPVRRHYLENLFGGLLERKRAEFFGLFLQGEMHAAAVLGNAWSRVIYMNGCSSPQGKETRAMFVLMDRLIHQSRNRYPVFDFEGSNLPGVARFFEGFGAFEVNYPRIVRTKFPFIGRRV